MLNKLTGSVDGEKKLNNKLIGDTVCTIKGTLIHIQFRDEIKGDKRMKKTVIGGFIMLGGLFTTLTVILCGAIYAPHITAWSGKSRLWHAIFGAPQYGGEVVQSLFLGFPFILGVIFTLLGLTILGMEYYKTFEKKVK